MPTETQLSLLAEIAKDGAAELRPEDLNEMLVLVADDYVESEENSDRFKLTARGCEALAARDRPPKDIR